MKSKRRSVPPDNPEVRKLVDGLRAWSEPLAQPDIDRRFLGWHERGYLPHRDEPGLVQFVTFRLADAFPVALRAEWEGLRKVEDDRQRRIELEAYLDLGRGACHLRQPEIAGVIESALKFRHPAEYELRAWVIMPNHVHVLFLVKEVTMAEVIGAWKSFTAKEANKILNRQGAFWQREYWDTFMRDGEQEARARRYIESNPTKAKLAATPKEWRWSSARCRDEYERLQL